MMTTFWNARYTTDEYVYGTLPNAFLSEQLEQSATGKILFPAEGEGRNAVFAAQLGFNVFAFDSSEVARGKALLLADDKNVSIQYRLAGYADVDYPKNSFDVIALIFAHMPAQFRREWHRKLVSYLKPGGKLILEGFSKDQLKYNSGGPKDPTMLFSIEELSGDFSDLKEVRLYTHLTELNEGEYHRGAASVIRLTGIKT